MYLQGFLNSTPDGDECSALSLHRFTSREEPSFHIEFKARRASRVGMEALKERKISFPPTGICSRIPLCPTYNLVTTPTELHRLTEKIT
jgi:hypothetical protein